MAEYGDRLRYPLRSQAPRMTGSFLDLDVGIRSRRARDKDKAQNIAMTSEKPTRDAVFVAMTDEDLPSDVSGDILSRASGSDLAIVKEFLGKTDAPTRNYGELQDAYDQRFGR